MFLINIKLKYINEQLRTEICSNFKVQIHVKCARHPSVIDHQNIIVKMLIINDNNKMKLSLVTSTVRPVIDF